MRAPYKSETLDRFMVRLPEGMRDLLKATAEKNKRTMNAEIVARLEASLEADVPDFTTPSPEDRLTALELAMAEVKGKLGMRV